jgi:hypothetical protein
MSFVTHKNTPRAWSRGVRRVNLGEGASEISHVAGLAAKVYLFQIPISYQDTA